MLAVAALFAALLQLSSVRADPTPLEPSSTSVFNEGSDCKIQWTADPTGVWKVMNIELMTGSNEQMVHLRTVATVDGTSTANNTFTYPCLAVDPNSQIYFYQFTSPNSTDVLWTTRFTIADPTGKSVPPAQQETNAQGEIIRYGTGKLQDPTLVDSPPQRGGTNGTTGASVNSTSAALSTSTLNVSSPTAIFTGATSIGDGIDTDTTSASSTVKPTQQAQKGGAVSYQRTAGAGILAVVLLCGSMLL